MFQGALRGGEKGGSNALPVSGERAVHAQLLSAAVDDEPYPMQVIGGICGRPSMLLWCLSALPFQSTCGIARSLTFMFIHKEPCIQCH